MNQRLFAVLIVAVAGAAAHMQAQQSSPAMPAPASLPAETLENAQRFFYSARYDEAADLTRELCSSDLDGLPACELRTAALLFQIKRSLGDPKDKDKDKDKAWKRCGGCPELMSAFQAAVATGQTVARARLQVKPGEQTTLFLLGKLDLNHVWLHLGTLGHKTGWREYWEARRALDEVLKQNPGHIRARVARAWIDYIVDTKMPRGTRWLLGGGNKKRGLVAVRDAANTESDFFSRAEARFALWDMQVRERNLKEAVTIARSLARDFPDNHELNTFLDTHDRSLPR